MRSSFFFVTLIVVLMGILASTASAQFIAQTCEAECKPLDKLEFSDEQRAQCWNGCYRAQCLKSDCIKPDVTGDESADGKLEDGETPVDPATAAAAKRFAQCVDSCAAWTCTRTCKPGYFGSVACKSGCEKNYQDKEEEEWVKPTPKPQPKPAEPKPVEPVQPTPVEPQPKPVEPKPKKDVVSSVVYPTDVLKSDQAAGAFLVRDCKKGLFGSCSSIVFVKSTAGKVWAFRFQCASSMGCLFGGKGKVEQNQVVAWNGNKNAKAERKGALSSVFESADEKSLLAAIEVFNGSWKKYSRKSDNDVYARRLIEFLTVEPKTN